MAEISQGFKTNFSLVNANEYTEAVMEKAQVDKVKFANMQYFEKAAASIILELECKKYLDIKNRISNTDPVFINDEGEIILLYFNENDITQKIRTIIGNLTRMNLDLD